MQNFFLNQEIFRNYFKYQPLSSSAKDLFKADKNNNNKIKYMITNELIKLMEDINIKEIPKNENPNNYAKNDASKISNNSCTKKSR